MTPRISVIIPVYRAEEYLAQSLDSVLAQRGCDFEIVLVNDGSPDRSPEICREYAARDARIRLLDKPNGGVSSARNMGLDAATGEWILFLDADDWLAPDAFVTLAPYMDDYEVIRFAIMDIFEGGRTHVRKLTPAANRDMALSQVLGHRTIIGVGGTMYRRSLFEQWGVRFSTELTYGEDWLVLATLLYRSRSVKTLDGAYLYLYNRYNEASCTNTMTSAKLVQSLVVVRKLRELVGQESYARELARARCRRVGALVKHCGFEATARELVEARNRIDMLTLRDILTSDIHLSLRVRLLRLWFGHLRGALREQ
ncbi:MAG: glycosyltransferase family 2 protein [Rikenellaceae bacterium]|nr:glycosyltransferase family 2 protein [Rikenellaceae bacterium]